MTEPIIEYREEINVTDIARKYAERVARVIDEQTLANVENQLAEFGYVKVVRCRHCKYFRIGKIWDSCAFTDKYAHADGFCAWGSRRDA